MTLERDHARTGRAPWQVLGPDRAIGCFYWVGAEVTEPSVIRQDRARRSPSASHKALRLDRVVAQAMTEADMRAPVRAIFVRSGPS